MVSVTVMSPPARARSWNRSKRTGYKVIRIRLKDGVPTGEYQDYFMVGFVFNDSEVWGRPVWIAVAHDGALLVSEDGNHTIRRITHRIRKSQIANSTLRR
jgi:glucose/arabinose dehydrogenase